MHQSRWGYRADFVVHPALLAGFATLALRHASLHQAGVAFASMAAGFAGWSALEYAIHRFAFHGVPWLRQLHSLHHAHPGARIGTPALLSAALMVGLWAALAYLSSPAIAAGLLAGLTAGYLLYLTVHHAVHHWRPRSGSWLRAAQRRHALHHVAEARCNYGVSTGLWDVIFGTATGDVASSSHPTQVR